MKTVARLAGWIMVLVGVGGLLAAGYLDAFVNPQSPGEEETLSDVLWSLSFVGFPIVGTIILFRLPRHPIGWILCGLGAGIGAMALSAEYAQYAYVTRSGEIAGGPLAAWLTSWLGLVPSTLFILLLIFFPSGAARNTFWRNTARAVIVIAVSLGVMYSLRAGPLDNSRDVDNPLGIESLNPIIEPIIPMLGTTLIIVMLVAIVDKIWVYRRSHGAERQQLKWFALAGLVFPVLFGITLLLEAVFDLQQAALDPVTVAWMVGLNSLAAAIGIAIFKYRLYDLGSIVNRTLVYGAVTALLVLVYVGGVVGLGGALRELTNQENNNLAVAASTLAVAALFRPARARIQGFIDRRFYRKKYDAAKTLETFNQRLRDEVDLDELSADLLAAIKETMQPAHASLWLRPEVGR